MLFPAFTLQHARASKLHATHITLLDWQPATKQAGAGADVQVGSGWLRIQDPGWLGVQDRLVVTAGQQHPPAVRHAAAAAAVALPVQVLWPQTQQQTAGTCGHQMRAK